MDYNSPKALYIEWIIDESSAGRVNASKRRNESDAEEKKSDAGDFLETSRQVTPQTKKSRVIRPTRPTTAEEESKTRKKRSRPNTQYRIPTFCQTRNLQMSKVFTQHLNVLLKKSLS